MKKLFVGALCFVAPLLVASAGFAGGQTFTPMQVSAANCAEAPAHTDPTFCPRFIASAICFCNAEAGPLSSVKCKNDATTVWNTANSAFHNDLLLICKHHYPGANDTDSRILECEDQWTCAMTGTSKSGSECSGNPTPGSPCPGI